MSKVVSRAQAREEGLTNFYTGKPCNRGHLSLRSVISKTCLACSRVNRKRVRKEEYIAGLDDPMPVYVAPKISRGMFPPEPICGLKET